MNDRTLSKGRLEALSDGVLGVLITLMFLGFENSYEGIRGAETSAEVWAQILTQAPRFLSYCLSFFIVGGFWLQHHLMFHYVLRVDRVFVALNLLFLMACALVPVTTDWLIEFQHHETNAVLIAFAVSYACCGLSLALTWAWATTDQRLVSSDLHVSLVRAVHRSIALHIAGCLASIAVSYVSVPLGISTLAITSLSSFWPRRHDGAWRTPGVDATPHPHSRAVSAV